MSTHTAKRRKINISPERTDSSNSSKSSTNIKQKPHGISTQVTHDEFPETKTISRRSEGKNHRSTELAFASGFHKSSMFKLQLDELLSESRPNYDKHLSKLQDTLNRLKDVIDTLAERSPKQPLEAEKELRAAHGILVPYPEPRPGKDAKYTVSFARPTNVSVVGSFALKTGIRMDEPHVVDLAVTMPSSLFQEKDYVNYRFFYKRAYYVACLAAGLQEAEKSCFHVKFGMQDGDNIRPFIALEPIDGPNKGQAWSQIRIITAIEENLFPVARTLPMKNNIRRGSTENSEIAGYTPFYNAILRSEATVASYHKFLHAAAHDCDSFKDACVLGRIWLHQRGLGSPFQVGGFGGFEWTALMSLLLEGGGPDGKPVLLKSYNSYQLFKATVQFIGKMDLMKPLTIFSTSIEFPSGSPVLYDGRRGQNILYKMTSWSYAFLRREAGNTINMLNESRDDNFENVFILKANEPMLRFDRLIAIPVSGHCNTIQTLKKWHAIYEVLSKSLGDRADLIYLSGQKPGFWSVAAKPVPKADTFLSVGLLLHPEYSTRVVDHGPSAEQKEEAAYFRAFWGEKAELRRFKDGSIRESLVWSDRPSTFSIVHQILAYILQRHFNYVRDDIKFVGDEYDEELRKSGDGVFTYSSPSFQLVADAFKSLENSFQNLDGVPLTVRHLAPASPLLRYSALRVENTFVSHCEPADIVLQFESSGRWPEDLSAIQMTKVAFLVKIGDSLQSTGVVSSSHVGLENESSEYLNKAFLDLTHTSGVVFRLRIHHDREQILLEHHLKEKGESMQAKQEIAYALSSYKRMFTMSPRFTLAIRTLCTRFPLLSPTIRLVKHWFRCHLLVGHINEELIELLTVRTFTQPYPWEPPASVMSGFLRTIYFISRWDWQQEPLIVDTGGELDNSAVEAIRTRFSAWRSVDPLMNSVALFAASDIDIDGVTWTQHEMPPKVVAARVSTLAKATLKLLREKGCTVDISQFFQTSLAPYDFVINLRAGIDDRPTLSKRYKNLKEQDAGGHATKMAIVRSFFRDLQACFNPNIMFFHGDEYSNVIAGLWKPQAMKNRDWSLKMPYSTSPKAVEKHDQVSINCEAILNEISRVGVDLVHSVEVHTMGT